MTKILYLQVVKSAVLLVWQVHRREAGLGLEHRIEYRLLCKQVTMEFF
jgi:cytochrome oxidase assembly protein ShyY1